jgi:small-conductance mechanosensitive channel
MSISPSGVHFRKHGIEIPFPQREVRVLNPKVAEVAPGIPSAGA